MNGAIYHLGVKLGDVTHIDVDLPSGAYALREAFTKDVLELDVRASGHWICYPRKWKRLFVNINRRKLKSRGWRKHMRKVKANGKA